MTTKRKSLSGSGKGLGAFFPDAEAQAGTELPTEVEPREEVVAADNKQSLDNHTDLQSNNKADKQVNNHTDLQSAPSVATTVEVATVDAPTLMTTVVAEPALERATFYIWSDQHPALDELKLKLRKRGLKTDKSELIRVAIELLISQELGQVETLLKNPLQLNK